MAEEHPIVVVGAGPVGLAAAAELDARGLPFVVLERGPAPGATVTEWENVRLFSMWRDLVDPAAEKLLVSTGWQRPSDEHYPNGAQWRDSYLVPLAKALGERVRFEVEVTGVSRLGRDRVVDADRGDQPFVIATRTATGEERLLAKAVIDASGTWTSPNPIGGNGLPAIGESLAADRITYRIPDMTDPAIRRRHAGRTTAVVGRGHSALTVLVALAELAMEAPGTRVLWVIRRDVGDAFGGGDDDQLAARGALGIRARRAVDAGHIDVVTGFRAAEVNEGQDGRAILVDDDGRALSAVDEIIALTGFRPDLSFLSEIRLGLDPALQAPVELAPLIDPNVHSCGTVYPHGAAELSHPESDFYLVGMKSYGRAPTFLALTGYEQVRSVAAALAGDHDSAARVELTLPETGVCSGSGGFDETAADAPGVCGDADAPAPVAEESGCCASTAAPQDTIVEPGRRAATPSTR